MRTAVRGGLIAVIITIGFVAGLSLATAQPDTALGQTGCVINGTSVTTPLVQSECDALVDLYVNTAGPNWKNSSGWNTACLLYTSPSPRDATLSRMPSSA